MTLIEFVAGIRFSGGKLSFSLRSLDEYFADLLPAALRTEPARLAFAAASHVALMTQARTLVTRGTALGVPGRDELALRAALTGTRADLVFSLWPGEGESLKGRVLRCLLLEGAAPSEPGPVPLPPPEDPHGVTLVRLLPAGGRASPRQPWGEGTHFDLPCCTLLVRP